MSSSALADLRLSLSAAVPKPLHVFRIYFAALTALAVAGLPGLLNNGYRSGQFLGTYSLQWTLLLGGALVLALAQAGLAVMVWTRASAWAARTAQEIAARLARLGYLNLTGFAAAWLVYVLVVLWRYGKHFKVFDTRVWLFWVCVGLGAVFLNAALRRLPFFWAALATALFYGMGVMALGYLPQLTSYPFSLSWSEASRFYYSSLPYANSLYGLPVPLSPWHPSRYLLLGLPYLLPGTTLLAHRAWQVFLWLALSLGAGAALVRRLGPAGRGARWAGVVWTALFLLQGPVYYHLLVCVIPVLVWFDGKRFWRSLAVLVLASLWAGISRINWIPVPAMLGVALYLLEEPLRPAGGWLKYLVKPALWGVLGCLAAYAAQAAYVPLSGHADASAFSSTFNSALLWYRLFPNPTYALGVLPAILLLTSPLLALAIGSVWRSRAEWHPLRLAGLGGMLLVLLAGGLVVSTKIGGGSNIHNMDAFLVLTALVGGYLWMGRGQSESGISLPAWRPWLLTLLVVVLPVTWNLNIGNPFVQRDFLKAADDLGEIQIVLSQVRPGGEVLFITQRQLITFGEVTGVKLVPEYELLTLSEMAISNNQPYLERFDADLRNHRFAVIVANIQNTITKDPERAPFSEENNAWVEHISHSILQYYESRLTLDKQGVELFFPKNP